MTTVNCIFTRVFSSWERCFTHAGCNLWTIIVYNSVQQCYIPCNCVNMLCSDVIYGSCENGALYMVAAIFGPLLFTTVYGRATFLAIVWMCYAVMLFMVLVFKWIWLFFFIIACSYLRPVNMICCAFYVSTFVGNRYKVCLPQWLNWTVLYGCVKVVICFRLLTLMSYLFTSC